MWLTIYKNWNIYDRDIGWKISHSRQVALAASIPPGRCSRLPQGPAARRKAWSPALPVIASPLWPPRSPNRNDPSRPAARWSFQRQLHQFTFRKENEIDHSKTARLSRSRPAHHRRQNGEKSITTNRASLGWVNKRINYASNTSAPSRSEIAVIHEDF